MNMQSLETAASKYAPVVLSILRIVVALLLLQHGLSKFFGFPATTPRPALFALVWFAGLIELVGGVLLLVGFLTRPVAFVLAGELAFAYFIGHAPRSFYPISNGGEAAVLFCFVFFYLAFAGGGPLSVDAMMMQRRGLLSRLR